VGGKQGIRVRVTLMHLSFHRTPIRKCTINVESKVCNVKTYTSLSNWCLPCSKEEGLVSVRLGKCCPPRVSEPQASLEPMSKVYMNVQEARRST
jgi:hypothetical protein